MLPDRKQEAMLKTPCLKSVVIGALAGLAVGILVIVAIVLFRPTGTTQPSDTSPANVPVMTDRGSTDLDQLLKGAELTS